MVLTEDVEEGGREKGEMVLIKDFGLDTGLETGRLLEAVEKFEGGAGIVGLAEEAIIKLSDEVVTALERGWEEGEITYTWKLHVQCSTIQNEAF